MYIYNIYTYSIYIQYSVVLKTFYSVEDFENNLNICEKLMCFYI